VDLVGLNEAGCQKMLLQGLQFLKDHPNFDFKVYTQYSNIYGICEGKGQDAKDLDEAVCKNIDPSGAMHQAVINHLAYIYKNGHDKWIQEARERDHKIYEIDGQDLDKTLAIAQKEWEQKLSSGYDPLKELLSELPKENIIEVNFNDSKSMNKAAKKIKKIIKNDFL
jgi:hypothetical protein